MGHALAISGSMTWEILWALILGFALSAVVQAAVRRATIVRLLGDDRPRTLAVATGREVPARWQLTSADLFPGQRSSGSGAT